MARKPRSQRIVDAYFSRDHFDDRETCCPLIALPSDVMRGSDAVKGAYREVLEKLIDIFLDDLDAPQRRERALALAALCIGGIVAPKCVDFRPWPTVCAVRRTGRHCASAAGTANRRMPGRKTL